MRTKTLFGLAAALALALGTLTFAPSTADAKQGWRGGHRGHHFHGGFFPGHRFHGHRFHRPHYGVYAYAPFNCWRVRYTPWGPQRVWVCGPRYYNY